MRIRYFAIALVGVLAAVPTSCLPPAGNPAGVATVPGHLGIVADEN